MRSLICHMDLILEDGSFADSTKNFKPARLNIGDGSISPAFEQQLINLNPGDKHSFSLEAKDAFGIVNQNAIHYMEKSRFAANISIKVGTIVNFTHPNGQQMPGIIRDVIGDSVTVDFNHPLAGHKIRFDLEVLEVL